MKSSLYYNFAQEKKHRIIDDTTKQNIGIPFTIKHFAGKKLAQFRQQWIIQIVM